jgi:hypothetical protein
MAVMIIRWTEGRREATPVARAARAPTGVCDRAEVRTVLLLIDKVFTLAYPRSHVSEYFGLREFPFSLAPDPRFLELSAQHREALAHLLYGVRSEGGFVQLTGEVGTGKTTVCRCFLEQLPPGTRAAVILNPALTAAFLEKSGCFLTSRLSSCSCCRSS